MKADELRAKARKLNVSGASEMRKEDLVHAVATATQDRSGASGHQSGGVRTGPESSKSLKYSQEVTSPDDDPERPGRSLVTTSHEVIRQWAEQRDAVPATVEGTEHDDHLGVLRFDFPGYGGEKLQHVDWDEWFATFDERQLNFIYQEERGDGSQSNFFRVENPGREDA
ncbi:Rho termination factor N-terminal domain-containing protein [Actinophytocola sp. NPDC049390]|uniref:Rho termination factor N-terminal domain-containing protein n=1 Tax=Actinophytocola sp. NPDC049390 TaxID=3363894 RepID=UPI0037998490